MMFPLFQTANELELIPLISDLTAPALMAIIIWGAIKEWWVPGKTHRRMVAERDELLRLALRGTTITKKTVEAAETFVEAVEK